MNVWLALRSVSCHDPAWSTPGLWTRLPNFNIIAHHAGGMIPFFEGRIGPGNDVMGVRTSHVDYVALRRSLKHRPPGLLPPLSRRYRNVLAVGSDPARHGLLHQRQHRFRDGRALRPGGRASVQSRNHPCDRRTGQFGSRTRRHSLPQPKPAGSPHTRETVALFSRSPGRRLP